MNATDEERIEDEVQPIDEEKDALMTGASEKKSKKKHWMVLGIVAAVLIAVGAGFWVWHEQPSFCNAICHQPMDSYVEGYYSKDPSLSVAVHASQGVACLSCHKSNLTEQVAEGVSWVSGGYDLPLEQRSFDDSFCLNAQCHDMSRGDLAKATEQKYNPHSDYHETLECGSCHKAHEPSVMTCTQCHSDAVVPDNWKAYGA